MRSSVVVAMESIDAMEPDEVDAMESVDVNKRGRRWDRDTAGEDTCKMASMGSRHCR